jgi:DNA-binding response OmpR family regulator
VKKRLLLVEDEENIRTSLHQYLEKEGYEVILSETLKQARLGLENDPDLVILDWMLPDGDGIELLKEWRKLDIAVPVILLTAKAETIDKVLGLELGANDYLTKPFEPRELLARIRVQLRSAPSQQNGKSSRLEYKAISMDLKTRETRFEGRSVVLTKMEFELLKLFVENPNQVFSRDELLNRVWGYDQFPTTRTVDTHILQLRQKLNEDLFETIRGIGYRLKVAK